MSPSHRRVCAALSTPGSSECPRIVSQVDALLGAAIVGLCHSFLAPGDASLELPDNASSSDVSVWCHSHGDRPVSGMPRYVELMHACADAGCLLHANMSHAARGPHPVLTEQVHSSKADYADTLNGMHVVLCEG